MNQSYWIARNVFEQGLVQLDQVTGKAAYFSVGKDDDIQSVIFDKTKKSWSCTCQHSSLWGVNKSDETCFHIKSCKMFIRR